ncbi:MAG: flavodoxin family protein [Candidatus Omnitrophica bacterium]|nr:flavodoxin family protein [Candidatus Omnitrophota bacterium]
MRITIFNGSPRGQKGNTHRMVTEFLKGAEDAGAQTENIFLAQKKIHYCLGCFSCWIKTPGKCAIKDDMQDLLEKYMKSDIVVLASPVYVGSVTGIMKNFIDRIIPLHDPHFEKNENGIYRHLTRYKTYPKIVLISNCGFPEQAHFEYFRSVFKYFEFLDSKNNTIIAEIYRGEGELLKVENIFLKPVLNNYRQLLRKAGGEIVKNQKLSDELKAELEKPLIPYDQYVKEANKSWDEDLKKVV